MPLFDREWFLVRRIGELEGLLQGCTEKNARVYRAFEKKVLQVDALNKTQGELHELAKKLKEDLATARAKAEDPDDLGTIPREEQVTIDRRGVPEIQVARDPNESSFKPRFTMTKHTRGGFGRAEGRKYHSSE